MKLSLIVGVVALAAAAQTNANLNVGDRVPAKPFQDVMYNWDGVSTLEDYLGEPVLVDWWGIN
ncbi:MAG: hypothetical protein JNJ88_01925 [Planctomycetes bacterium]|nr:hypothetical protein [Planctomycetota bacterium]